MPYPLHPCALALGLSLALGAAGAALAAPSVYHYRQAVVGLTAAPIAPVNPAADDLQVSVAALDFGPATTGSSRSLSVTLQNKSPSVAGALSLGALSAPFSQISTTCGASLAAGAACAVTVGFSPAAVQSYSGVWSVSLGPLASAQLALAGVGEMEKTYATMDATRKSGSGTLNGNTVSNGSAFYVQSSLARSGFYYEGRVTSYYGAVGLGSPTAPLQFDSGGNLYLGNFRAYTAPSAPTASDIIGFTWDGTVAALYINGVLHYTTPAGWLAAGPQRVLLYSNGGSATANLGASAFAYPVPAGFSSGLY